MPNGRRYQIKVPRSKHPTGNTKYMKGAKRRTKWRTKKTNETNGRNGTSGSKRRKESKISRRQRHQLRNKERRAAGYVSKNCPKKRTSPKAKPQTLTRRPKRGGQNGSPRKFHQRAARHFMDDICLCPVSVHAV